MEKGPKSFSEEKAKEIMEVEGMEERSQAEQDAFEAGRNRGKESYDYDLEEAYGLGPIAVDLVRDGKIEINGGNIYVSHGTTPEEFLSFVKDSKHLPKDFNLCKITESITDELIDELINRKEGDVNTLFIGINPDYSEINRKINKMESSGKSVHLYHCRKEH